MAKRRNSVKADDTDSLGISVEDENTAKYSHLESTHQETKSSQRIICTLPPHNHPPAFSTSEEYELHYKKAHANRCTECMKNFPTEHYLNLHIAENHDPLIQARQARCEKTFACFVEDCEKVCLTAHKRRMHLIDKHLFPKNYDFFIVNDGLKGRKSLLRPSRPKQSNSVAVASQKNLQTEDEESEIGAQRRDSEMTDEKLPTGGSVDRTSETYQLPATADDDDYDIQGIAKSMSELKFVPNSVRFGRGRGRGGLARK